MQLNTFLEKSIKALLYVVPFLLLIFYQGTLYPFLTLKTVSLYIVVSLILILWAVLVIRKRGEHLPVFTKTNGLFLLFVCVATLSGLVSETPLRSLWSTPERLTGVVTLWVFFFYSLALTTFIRKEEWKKYFFVSFIVAGAVGAFALLQTVSPETFFVKNGSRPGGTLGNPAYLAGYLVSYLFLGVALLKSRLYAGWKKTLLILASVFSVFAFFGANTRGAVLGLIVALVCIVALNVYQKIKEGRSRKWYAAAASTLLMLLGGFIYVTSDSPLWAKVPGINRFANFSVEDSSIANRLIEWKIALVGFTQQPIVGSGYENFRLISDANYDPRLLRGGFGDTYFDKPHNVPLEVLATTGATGFVVFVLLWITIFIVIKKSDLQDRSKRLAYGAAIAFFIQNCFLFDTFGTHLTFAIAIAALSAISATQEERPALALRSFVIVPALVAILLIYASVSLLRGSVAHYAMLNAFIQDKTSEGIAAYEEALSIYYPFKPLLAQDALSSVVERVRAAVNPTIGVHVPRVMSDVATAITTDPRNYFLRISLADSRTVFFRLNREILKGVDEEILAAERISPRRQQTLFVRAKVKLLRGDREGAFADMKEAIALDPQAAMPHYNYAKLLAQFTTGREVIEAFDAAFAKGYRTSSALELAMLGGYYGDANRYEEAYRFFKQAYEIDPGNNEYLAKYGLTSFYTQRNEEARQVFTHLLKVMPQIKDSPNYPVFLEIFKEIGVTPL